MPRLAGVLLGDLQLDGLLAFRQRAEQGRDGFPHLEIDGTVLDLNQGVVVELAVEGMEVVVGGAGAVVVGVLPVHVVVVHEAAIEEQATVGLERARHHVGRIRMRAPVGRRAHAAFGIGLQDQTAQIGNGAVELLSLGLPPRGYARIERIESIETANRLGAAEIHRQRDANAPGAKRRGNARHLRDEIGGENARVGVHVGDGAAVDAE